MPPHRDRSRSPRQSSTKNRYNDDYDYTRRSRYQRDEFKSPSHDDRNPSSLPLQAAPLSKHDLKRYRSLLGLYLDIQKQICINDLTEDEVKGRWKSFVKKWNAGDLAEGWYDPATLAKAEQGASSDKDGQDPRHTNDRIDGSNKVKSYHDESEEDDYGPHLPESTLNAASQPTTGHDSLYHNHQQQQKQQQQKQQQHHPGPSIPSTTDLQALHEERDHSTHIQRTHDIESVRASRKADRHLQRERLDDLIPRAEPGSRERQLEKRREQAASNRAFAEAKDGSGGGVDVDLKDADVMGDEDSLDDMKRRKEVEQRKRSERELRREEILRARAAEREERLRGLREKEAKTVEMLKGIAKAKFG